MANEVKWIKIVTDIFDDEKMYAIECMPDGRDIELVWFKLLCLAGKCNQNGFLMITNKLAYTDEMLSKIFRMDLGIVQRALGIFQQLDMVEVVDNAYMVSNWLIYQSGDRLEEMKEKHRISQQKYREKQKNLPSVIKSDITGDVTNDITPSYSYSISNSNISNFNNIINNTDTYISILNNNALLEVIKAWMEYKDERKPKSSNHYTERGMNSFLKIVLEKVEKFGADNVVKVIDYTMSNNWQGVVWDWLDKNAKTDSLSDLNKKAMEEW